MFGSIGSEYRASDVQRAPRCRTATSVLVTIRRAAPTVNAVAWRRLPVIATCDAAPRWAGIASMSACSCCQAAGAFGQRLGVGVRSVEPVGPVERAAGLRGEGIRGEGGNGPDSSGRAGAQRARRHHVVDHGTVQDAPSRHDLLGDPVGSGRRGIGIAAEPGDQHCQPCHLLEMATVAGKIEIQYGKQIQQLPFWEAGHRAVLRGSDVNLEREPAAGRSRGPEQIRAIGALGDSHHSRGQVQQARQLVQAQLGLVCGRSSGEHVNRGRRRHWQLNRKLQARQRLRVPLVKLRQPVQVIDDEVAQYARIVHRRIPRTGFVECAYRREPVQRLRCRFHRSILASRR
jgi:hypothetical protein